MARPFDLPPAFDRWIRSCAVTVLPFGTLFPTGYLRVGVKVENSTCPSVVDPAKLEDAVMLRDRGASIREITEKTGLKRTTLYRLRSRRPLR